MGGWGFILDAIGRAKENERVRGKSSARIKAHGMQKSYAVMAKGTKTKFSNLTSEEIEAIKIRYNRRLKIYRRKFILTIVITVILSIPAIYIVGFLFFSMFSKW